MTRVGDWNNGPWEEFEKKGGDRPEGWFPMNDFSLVGLVSLNDPPRPKVDVSVRRCKDAGIKVIMVTGDQPPTAAAIATKVNIIKDLNKEMNEMQRLFALNHPGQTLSDEEAFRECDAIVIHGDKLAKVSN